MGGRRSHALCRSLRPLLSPSGGTHGPDSNVGHARGRRFFAGSAGKGELPDALDIVGRVALSGEHRQLVLSLRFASDAHPHQNRRSQPLKGGNEVLPEPVRRARDQARMATSLDQRRAQALP